MRKTDEKGGFYHEPPYSREETADFYRRTGDGPVAFSRPSPAGDEARRIAANITKLLKRPQ